MVKHSPNKRLRLLQQQPPMDSTVNAEVHPPPVDGPPALEAPGGTQALNAGADELPAYG